MEIAQTDTEFFQDIDVMLAEKLTIKTLKYFCQEFEEEVALHRGEYKNNFKLALEMGERGEKIVRKFLESKGYIFLSKCENNSHDYIFLKDGKEHMFEIKTDVRHLYIGEDGELHETGNIAIEYESRGKESGISVTNAQHFLTYFPSINEIWTVQVNKLKALLVEKQDEIRSVTGGDTNSLTKMYLMNREKFKDNFRVVNLY